MSAALTGFITSFGLILAIGAQNAFVLRQGILRQYVLPIVLFCAISDALLIFVGVYGFGAVIERMSWIEPIMRIAGIAFLLFYGILRFRAVLATERLEAATQGASSLSAALLTIAAFTYLNPHVYIDTILLLGNIANGFSDAEKLPFAFGAASASFVFFFTLAFGARLVSPIFANPLAWKILDFAIGCLMLYLAFWLWQG